MALRYRDYRDELKYARWQRYWKISRFYLRLPQFATAARASWCLPTHLIPTICLRKKRGGYIGYVYGTFGELNSKQGWTVHLVCVAMNGRYASVGFRTPSSFPRVSSLLPFSELLYLSPLSSSFFDVLFSSLLFSFLLFHISPSFSGFPSRFAGLVYLFPHFPFILPFLISYLSSLFSLSLSQLSSSDPQNELETFRRTVF